MPLKDLLPKHQLELMKSRIGDRYLNMEVPSKVENIKEGEWSLTKEEKDKAIDLMFGVDSKAISSKLKKFKPTEHFMEVFKDAKTIKHEINLLNPSILDIKVLNTNCFRLISINETKSDKMISRDSKGHPNMDSTSKKPIMIDKEKGAVVFTQNKSNFNAFFESYIGAFGSGGGVFKKELTNPFTSKEFTEILSYARGDMFDTELFSKFDLQLYISSKPEDILNMSVSKYYDSCQNLYNGGHNMCLPANIFDRNSKIAYLKFNTPFKDSHGNIVPFSIFSRCIIRNIKGDIYFDIVYPKSSTQLRSFFHDMISKYTGMKSCSSITSSRKQYYYTDVGLSRPYFDTVEGHPIKFNPNAINNPRIIGLGKFVKEAPEHIIDKSDKHLITSQGEFLVLSNSEANEESIKLIRSGMVYKQDLYKPHVDISKFYKDYKVKGKLLYGYKGEINFESIAKWLTEKPEKEKKRREYLEDEELFGHRDRDDKDRKYISIHQMYREMIPYINPQFYEERLNDNNIKSKRRKIADDDIEIDLGNGYFAYKIIPKKN